MTASESELFTYKLSLALGCTRRELLQRVDGDELHDYHAVHHINPFPYEQIVDAITQLTTLCQNFFASWSSRSTAKRPSEMRIDYVKSFLHAVDEAEATEQRRLSDREWNRLHGLMLQLAHMFPPSPNSEIPHYVRYKHNGNQGSS